MSNHATLLPTEQCTSKTAKLSGAYSATVLPSHRLQRRARVPYFTTLSLPLQLDHRGRGRAQQLLDRAVAFDSM